MLEELNNLNMKSQNIAKLKVILQAIWENLLKQSTLCTRLFLTTACVNAQGRYFEYTLE